MTETTLDERVAAIDAENAAYLATLPPELAALIRPLKVGRSLAGALRNMEQTVYRAFFDMAEARVSALLSAALLYRDLDPIDHQALEVYLHDMGRARRDFLSELSQTSRPDPAWMQRGPE